MYEDDLLNAAQRRRQRTGQSFFPAATTGLRTPPQRMITNYSGSPSTYGSQGILGPDQNPAYQAAISRPRLQRGDLTTIRTPSGGYATVPSSSAGAAAQAVPGSQVTQIGNQAPIDYAAAYRRGYGAPTPSIQQFTGGTALVQGGVANPVSNLTPAQRIQYRQGGFLDYLRAGPTSLAVQNTLGGFGRNIASWFGGGNAPSSFGVNSAAGAPPSPTPIPSATPMSTATPYQPTPTPARRYSDYGYY